MVRLLAVAPEYPENAWLIEECVRRGVTVTAAHTAATYEQMVRAVALGVRQATHSYNAMLPLGHREPGTVGAILTLPGINCELIADNIHVHPAAMQVLAAAKGPAGVILVTDAVRPAGLPDGEYPFAGGRSTCGMALSACPTGRWPAARSPWTAPCATSWPRPGGPCAKCGP